MYLALFIPSGWLKIPFLISMTIASDISLILIAVLSVGVPFAYQCYCVIEEKHGYRKDPKFKDHPELKGVRKGDKMLYVNFKDLDK